MRYDLADKVIAILWTILSGIILIGIFVGLGLFAVEQMPDPKQQEGQYVK